MNICETLFKITYSSLRLAFYENLATQTFRAMSFTMTDMLYIHVWWTDRQTKYKCHHICGLCGRKNTLNTDIYELFSLTGKIQIDYKQYYFFLT